MAALNNGIRRSNARVPNAFRPGHLLWMPAGSTWLNREKPRPFVLTTSADQNTLGTLVYGSTQETEKLSGAAYVEVAPAPHGLNRNGLHRRTYFYPGTLIPVVHERLPASAGFLGKSLHELRTALRTALGIGRGACIRPGAPAGSCRGRVVAVHPDLAREIQASSAVVLTEPEYSAHRHYQIILPIVTAAAQNDGRFDLVASASKWPGLFEVGVDRVLLPVPLTQSVWHPDDIAGETEYVVDDGTLAEIDRRLCDYFSLAPVDEGR